MPLAYFFELQKNFADELELNSVVNYLPTKTKTLQARIVSGSAVMLTSSALTTVTNLAYNIFIARFLGPTGFGHAAVVYTLLTLFSAATLSFQIVSTKLAVQQTTPEGKAAVYRVFHRGAWACGLVCRSAYSFFFKMR